uniref:Protection of telomeres protein 1a n=1 Tax=Noccaea caerulescens TaxID=107243 RepID=A0A1J3DK35_NOCCA
MENNKSESLKLVKLKDAINLINQEVNLLGVIIERREPKRCRNNAWICTLRIIDDSYNTPGLTVNVFSNKIEKLPNIKNKNHNDMILFIRIKMQSFGDGKGVSGACNQRVSSFAVYEGRTTKELQDGFVCYQYTSNFLDEAQYKSSIDYLGKVFASDSIFGEDLQSSSYRTKAKTPEKFSFLREIKERKRFDLLCKILHVNEDMSTIFVWDGTDAPPASILSNAIKDKEFSSLSVNTLLSREILRGFPTVGTILRVSLSSHLFHLVKPGEWVKLYQLLCEVHSGSWIGKATNSTTVSLAQDDHLVEKITRIYDKRISSNLGHIPYWSFPSPRGLTETDEDQAPFVTLMDIITFPKVTYKYRCIVRVVDSYPWQVEELSSDENRRCRVLLSLEDPTATLEAFLCDNDAEYFWGLGLKNTEILRKKWNRLVGIKESSMCLAPRKPPWIECCIFSYYTDKADPWKTRLYRIFGTRFLN